MTTKYITAVVLHTSGIDTNLPGTFLDRPGPGAFLDDSAGCFAFSWGNGPNHIYIYENIYEIHIYFVKFATMPASTIIATAVHSINIMALIIMLYCSWHCTCIQQYTTVCVCVCVLFPSILDIKFVGRTSRGHTGGRSHRISHPPSFCGACLNFSREKDSAIPFPRRP